MCEGPYIVFKGAMHVDTWHAMCHTHGLPCVTHACLCHALSHMACHVSHMHAFAMHCDTWLAMCHPHGLPCVTHMACHVSRTWLSMCHAHGLPCVTHMVLHVSSTWLSMCRPILIVSKYVKFRLSRNSTKFDWVARFHETIPMVQSISSSEI